MDVSLWRSAWWSKRMQVVIVDPLSHAGWRSGSRVLIRLYRAATQIERWSHYISPGRYTAQQCYYWRFDRFCVSHAAAKAGRRRVVGSQGEGRGSFGPVILNPSSAAGKRKKTREDMQKIGMRPVVRACFAARGGSRIGRSPRYSSGSSQMLVAHATSGPCWKEAKSHLHNVPGNID